MRFVTEGDLAEKHSLFQLDPSSAVAIRVKSIADKVEEQLREDDVSLCFYSHCLCDTERYSVTG